MPADHNSSDERTSNILQTMVLGLISIVCFLVAAKQLSNAYNPDLKTTSGRIYEVTVKKPNIFRVNLVKPTYIRFSGDDTYFLLPALMFSTPSYDTLRAARSASIQYEGEKKTTNSITRHDIVPHISSKESGFPQVRFEQPRTSSFYHIVSITLDGKEYITYTTYQLELALRAVALILIGIAPFAGGAMGFTRKRQ